MGLVSRAQNRYRRDGLLTLLYWVVRFCLDDLTAPVRPAKTVEFNGIDVEARRFGDWLFPWAESAKPTYEAELITGIESSVKPGDRVVIIGGGWGVSTVIASDRAGASGQVVAYEPSDEWIHHLRRTVEINDTPASVSIHHHAVGEVVEVFGTTSADVIAPSDLPDAEVLVMDCEGAERSILDGLSMSPRDIIVETHGHLGSPTEKVVGQLERLGYSIESKTALSTEERAESVDDDVSVIHATS